VDDVEATVFSRKHQKLDVTLWIDGRSLPLIKKFKYLAVFFDYAGVHKYDSCKADACKD
jgi:hypothetical protein